MSEFQGRSSPAETETEEATPAPIPRIRHARRLFGFVAAVVIVGATAFVAGAFVHPPEESALKHVDATIDVWAKAQERSVYEGFSLPAAIGAAAEVDVIVTEASPHTTKPAESAQKSGDSGAGPSSEQTTAEKGPSDTSSAARTTGTMAADRVVVSVQGTTAGAALAYGQFLAEVSGRPVFSWPSAAPLYRNLVVGMSGSDVRGIQTTLKMLELSDDEPDGVFGGRTLRALSDLYARAGHELPVIQGDQRGLSWREFAAIPGLPATVIATADSGSVLSPENPLLTVRSTTPTLTAMASVRDIPELQPGAEVGVSVDGKPAMKTTVNAVGEFTTDDDTNRAGYPLSLVFPAELGAVAPGTSAVLRRWDQQPPAVSVPATAIRQDADGPYVLTRPVPGSAEGAPTRLAVRVTAQADGWVAIERETALAPGTEVLVSRRASRG